MKNTIVTIIASILFFAGCEMVPGESGAFEYTQKVDIINPDDGETVTDQTYFEWDNKDITPGEEFECIAVFSEMPKIKNSDILNMESCVGGLKTTSIQTDLLDTGLYLLEMKTYSQEEMDFTDTDLVLENGSQYYWLFWSLDRYGNLSHSSEIYSFTYSSITE
jgi:hypothetical protein